MAISMVITLLSALLVFHIGTMWYGNRTYRNLGYVAIVGHAFIGVVILHLLAYTWDLSQFHRAALAFLAGQPIRASSPVSAFGTFQALFYMVFGAHPIVISIVNGTLAVISVWFIRCLACHLYPELDRDTLLVAVALFTPLPFLFLSIPIRESLTTFCFLLTLGLTAVSLVENRYWFMLPIGPLYGALYVLRPELALLAVLGGAVAAAVKAFNGIAREPVTPPLVAGVAAIIGLFGFVLFFDRFPVSRLNSALSTRATGGAAYLESMHYDGMLDVVLAAPIRAIFFQFAPFPLHITSSFDFLAAATVPFLVFLLVAGYWSIRRLEVHPVVLSLLLTVYIGGIVGYGLIDSNFGTAVRHRIPFEFLLIIFAAPAFANMERSIRRLVYNPNSHRSGKDE